jgi:signal transduction histidine kinase
MSEETARLRVDILLVDDSPANLDALEAILERRSYNILRALDAESALHLLLEHDVAAIVLDLYMPNVNGLELARTIKSTRRYRQIPILFLTALMVSEEDIIIGYGAGAVDYLTKPVNPVILRHKVAVFAELFRKTRALAELNENLEQRVAERTAALEQSEAALRATAREKDEFLAILSHELRNPLAPLRTGIGLLMHASPKTLVVERTLGAMHRQVEHIVRLLDDLLDVSRISRGVLALKKQPVELGAIVWEAVEAYQPIFDQKGVTLIVDVLPDVHAVVDRTRVVQIVGNLLDNASKYTKARGRVVVSLAFQKGQARVRVIDDGVGIQEGQLERVFEMFARVEDTAGVRGAGIGLALSRRLAQLHDGRLSAWSAGEGRGSIFTLVLPAEEKPGIGRAVPNRGSNPAPAGPLDVLVIEDNHDAAEMVALWLQELGHHVHVARTGGDGLALASSVKPQVVFCDLGLPDIEGLEVCRRIRAKFGSTPLMVALTGWGTDDDRQRTAACGFDHHLVKPVAVSVLTDVLNSVRPVPGEG